MIHARDGTMTFQPYGKDETEALHSVNEARAEYDLVQAAPKFPTVRPFSRRRCTGWIVPSGTWGVSEETTRAHAFKVAMQSS